MSQRQVDPIKLAYNKIACVPAQIRLCSHQWSVS